MLALHTACSLAFVYILFSLVEYTTHRWLMHRMRIARALGLKFLATLCFNHMALHHKRGYDHEDHEEDDHLSHILIAAACVGMPMVPIVWLIDPFTVGVGVVFSVVYSVGWRGGSSRATRYSDSSSGVTSCITTTPTPTTMWCCHCGTGCSARIT
jgi:hypothetical protein